MSRVCFSALPPRVETNVSQISFIYLFFFSFSSCPKNFVRSFSSTSREPCRTSVYPRPFRARPLVAFPSKLAFAKNIIQKSPFADIDTCAKYTCIIFRRFSSMALRSWISLNFYLFSPVSRRICNKDIVTLPRFPGRSCALLIILSSFLLSMGRCAVADFQFFNNRAELFYYRDALHFFW